jgi:acyl dehydratase
MIIPGWIGGRMVKFLEEITVTESESTNFYHYHDNRVMPPHVDEELAKKEGEWLCWCAHARACLLGMCLLGVCVLGVRVLGVCVLGVC